MPELSPRVWFLACEAQRHHPRGERISWQPLSVVYVLTLRHQTLVWVAELLNVVGGGLRTTTTATAGLLVMDKPVASMLPCL